jgi:hypothetical protein
MSEDLVPDRRGLRVSHEDRDQVAEQLRISAGDGRLTAEELDERLEKALTARTYGELELLLLDLPPVPGSAQAPVPGLAPVTKDLVQLKSRSGNIERVGPWIVPKRLEMEVRSGNTVIDFTQAIITQSTLDIAVELRSGNLKLIVPPEVAVDVDSVAVRSGSIKQRVHREPGTQVRLLVTVSGNIRSGNVIVRGPSRGFWNWLLRRSPDPAIR